VPSYLKKMAWKTITMTNLSHPAPQFSTGDAEKLGAQLFNVSVPPRRWTVSEIATIGCRPKAMRGGS
jgi:hypothetical protein